LLSLAAQIHIPAAVIPNQPANAPKVPVAVAAKPLISSNTNEEK
jgi:hypothetical protein